MHTSHLALLVALALPFTTVACAAEGPSDDESSVDEELARKSPSKALSAAFLGGTQTGPNELVEFISVGHLAGSSKTCLTSASVWSKAPPTAHWNDVSIASSGGDGGVSVPFLNGKESTSEPDSLETRGKTLRYLRRSNRGTVENRAELTFATTPKGAENLRRVALNIHGTTTACEDLRSLVVLRDSISKPIVLRARDEYARSRGQSMSDLEYRACELLNPTSVLCDLSTDDESRSATILFSLSRGKLGDVRAVEVSRR